MSDDWTCFLFCGKSVGSLRTKVFDCNIQATLVQTLCLTEADNRKKEQTGNNRKFL